MQSMLFDPRSAAIARAQFWFYRIGGYLLLNVMDEPAWLALIFC
ncbi:MAG: hypothetical protein WCJ76_10400 [Comamonadaceae bacterium]